MAIPGNVVWWRHKASWRGQRQRLRQALRAAQHNRCAICGEMFGSVAPTFEHVVPRHVGGTHVRNLVLTHYGCNQRRGGAMPTGCLLVVLEVVNARLTA